MADVTIPEYRVPVEQLRPGVFIRLERVNWFSHPFLLNTFKIRSDDQIAVLQSLGIDQVICIPEKSDRLPAPPTSEGPRMPRLEASPEITPEARRMLDELWQIKRERAERLREKKAAIARCEELYVSSLEEVSALMREIGHGQAQAVDKALECVARLADHFLSDMESTLHLMSIMGRVERIYYHSLNVAVLAMMVGKEMGLLRDDMLYLGMGALFHDIGKVQIDKRILRKAAPLTKAEQAVYEKHPEFGLQILQKITQFPKPSLLAVLQHHELFDGSGFPAALAGEKIDILARIVAVADVYDNHCNHADTAKSYTPYQALSYMYSRQRELFDPKVLGVFIRCLGIYPPGTVVQLTSGTIGMVIAVNAENQLAPSLVVYDPEIPKKEALVIDLAEEQDLKIEKSIRPTALPPEIFEYLSPRTRISYYVEPDDRWRG